MARRESTLFNMILALSAILFVFALILGITYILTEKKIHDNHQAKAVASVKKVLPPFNNDPVAESYTANTPRGEMRLYPGRLDGKLTGIAVETLTDRGYSGIILLMAGFYPDGRIVGIEVLEHRETPGLGSKIDTAVSDFPKQFKDKDPKTFELKIKKDGGHVDGITAATISARAYCDAISFAYETLTQHRKDQP